MSRTLRPAFLLAVLLVLGVPASRAQAQAPEAAPEQIRLPLAVEGWVATDTAEVVLSANVTLVGQDPAKARAGVMKAFKKIEDAPWRIVAFDRNTDAAGAERWTVDARARVAQMDLDGLHERARRESMSGKAFRVASVDTSPSLAEREAVLRGLRSQIYAMAKQEVPVAKVLWPSRDIRITRVEFVDARTPGPVPYMASAARSAAGSVSTRKSGKVSTEQKIVLGAWVTLSPKP